MSNLYRKLPKVIEAVQYQPGMEDGWTWLSGDGGFTLYDTEAEAKRAAGGLWKNCAPIIKTLEGFHEISAGDWIITGVAGERYPCKPDIFAATYEPADTPSQPAERAVDWRPTWEQWSEAKARISASIAHRMASPSQVRPHEISAAHKHLNFVLDPHYRKDLLIALAEPLPWVAPSTEGE